MFILFQFLPIAIIFIFSYVFLKRIVLWETLVGIAASALITFIGYGIGVKVAVMDTEFFSNSIVSLTYYEYWESWVEQTCTRTYDCNCSTDSDGRQSCDTCTEYYDCSYCDRNSSYYAVTLNDGKVKMIHDAYGQEIQRKWKASEQFLDMHRHIHNYGGCGEDGDAYVYYWDNKEESAFTFCSEHTYENRIQASDNLYRDHQQVIEEIAVDYPKVNRDGKQKHLMGLNNNKVEQYLQYVNGAYGKDLQIKYFVYVWPDTTDRIVVENQKRLWLRCNKNEFILCLFIDQNQTATDIDFITWSESGYNEILTYDGDEIETVVRKTWQYLKDNWVRLEFSKFSFLSVRPSNTSFIVTFIINIISCAVIMYVFYFNYHDKKILL